jgi:predicted esterase
MTSRSGHVTTVRFEPPGTEPLPTLVFLHGFGGLMTPYVETIGRALAGRWLVVAPALDPVGAWRTKRGQAVLRETLAQLPPRADRSRVFLVGLSNGAVGALQAARAEDVRRQLAGLAVISGIAWAGDALSGLRVLVVAGKNDPRFPIAFVEEKTAELGKAGAVVDALTLDASHALVLSHADTWVSKFATWAE